MLLKLNYIVSHEKMIMDNLSEQEMLDLTKKELVKKLAQKIFDEKLVKFEIMQTDFDSFGDYTKITASVRVYHPDN